MKRGDLYRVRKPSSQDPNNFRVFVVVSRQIIISSRFSTVLCAPINSTHDGLSTQVIVGTAEGLKHEGSIHCDELIRIPKSDLTNFLGSLSDDKIKALNEALKIALDLNG